MNEAAPARDASAFFVRLLAWGAVLFTTAFVIENYLVFWLGLSPARALLSGSGGAVSAAVYAAAAAGAVLAAVLGARGPLRADSARITAIVAWIARGAFFGVLFVGIVDAAISMLRIEGALAPLVGEAMASSLGQSTWRGLYIHMPLIAAGFVLAFFTRTLGFIWLALGVVVVQLLLVIGRFVFSYEQAFVTDLVRMWYAALFLFASAYTLVEEGHVRVDVFYSGMSRRGRALVNGIGTVGLGMTLCWVILILGTATGASVINGPLLRYETGQQAFGMYTKYLLAGFLLLFAYMMMLQFAGYLLKAAADWRDEPDPNARAGAPAAAGH